MKFKLTFIHGVGLGLILLLFFLIRGCQKNNELIELRNRLSNYKDTVLTYKAKNGELVDYNIALKADRKELLAMMDDTIKEYLKNLRIPKPDAIIVASERWYIDSIPAVGLNIKGCEFDTTFSIIDRWYEIKGRVTEDILSIQSIMLPNKNTFIIGDRKEKWWKKSEYIITASNTNPHIQTEGIQSFVFNDPKTKLSVGPSIGYGICYNPGTNNITNGFILGIGLNYRIFGFNKRDKK